MENDLPDVLNRGLAAVTRLAAGETPDGVSLDAAAEALAAVRDACLPDGKLDDAAEADAWRATALRQKAELPGAGQDDLLVAHAAAMAAQALAIRAAEAGGVTDRNLAAYVRTLDDAGASALALGLADLTPLGTARLGEAAESFGEAATGHRRLGNAARAEAAQIKALAARSARALRGG